ncbi:HD domain-containing protein [Aspergillus undulatus]|uniref:HD domain-containing protein n=1 Tax=Aspergillus undulatus TaxID=1810928 RepID=UPI003CCE0366
MPEFCETEASESLQPWTLAKAISSFPTIPEINSTSPLPFFHLLERLKTTPREGWRQAGLSQTESISDHMYRMAIMVLLAPPSISPQLRTSRCLKMVLIHDMAEAVVGDITPKESIPKLEKARRGDTAMRYIAQTLLGNVPGGKEAGEEIISLFREYEDGVTLEAVFAHDLDKLEMVLQAVEYERLHGRDLAEFYHVVEDIRLPVVREWAEMVMKEREGLGMDMPF